MSGLLARLFSRREAATVPSMDGVLRPNTLLDQASPLAALREPDNLVQFGSNLAFSSGNDVLVLVPDSPAGSPPELFRRFESRVTALAVSSQSVLAVGLDGKGIGLIGGAYDGLALDQIGGVPAKGPTALAFADADTLIVCIGSAQNGPDEWQRDLMEMRATGSVWKVDLRSKAATMLASGLAFPNGVLIRGNRVVVSESWRHRLLGFDLAAVKAMPDIVLEDLPGYPGRLSEGRDGGAWLAVFAPRSQLIEFALRERAYCLRMLREIPKEYWIAPTLRSGRSFREPMQGGAVRVHGIYKPWAPTRSYGLAVQLDTDLLPVRSFHSRADGSRHGIVSICEWQDRVVFASRGDDLLCTLPLDPHSPRDAAR